MQRQGGLSVEAMCDLARVARSGYYRFLRSQTGEEVNENLMGEESLYEPGQQNPEQQNPDL